MKTRPRAQDGTVGPGNPPEGLGVDLAFMELAIEEARLAFRADEVPVGAVVVTGGTVLARAGNRTRARRDPTAHAELLALRRAAARVGYERLLDCTVYSTLEPCHMCAGALVQARVARLVFATRDPKFGAVRSLGRVLEHPGLNHRVRVHEGVHAEEAGALLREFFRNKRRFRPPSGGLESGSPQERCQSG